MTLRSRTSPTGPALTLLLLLLVLPLVLLVVAALALLPLVLAIVLLLLGPAALLVLCLLLSSLPVWKRDRRDRSMVGGGWANGKQDTHIRGGATGETGKGFGRLRALCLEEDEGRPSLPFSLVWLGRGFKDGADGRLPGRPDREALTSLLPVCALRGCCCSADPAMAL